MTKIRYLRLLQKQRDQQSEPSAEVEPAEILPEQVKEKPKLKVKTTKRKEK